MFRQHPSYEQRLDTNDQRVRLSLAGDLIRSTAFIVSTFLALSAALYARIRYRSMYQKLDAQFFEYQNMFGPYGLTGNIHKAQESLFYRELHIQSPSLEIGICRGDVSNAHFKGKHFDVGSEYLGFLVQDAFSKYKLWSRVQTESLLDLQHNDESMNTICLVHTIDHVEDLETSLKELSRVLRPGGRVFFSGYSHNLYKYDPIRSILSIASQAWARRYCNYLSRKRHHYNLLDFDQWRIALSRHGFLLETYHLFEGGPLKTIRHILNIYVAGGSVYRSSLAHHLSSYRWMRQLYAWLYNSIGGPVYVNQRDNGVLDGSDFFIAATRVDH